MASKDPPVYIVGTDYLAVIDGKAHLVGKDRKCHVCQPGQKCDAVKIVARYLKAGGQRAPDMLVSQRNVVDFKCPVCGSDVTRDVVLDNWRGIGWRCKQGGYAHLYQHRYGHLKEWYCSEGARRHEIFIETGN